MPGITPLARRIIDLYQHDLPATAWPYAEMARACGCSEAEVIDALGVMTRDGVLARVGAVVAPGRAGVGTLAAMEVPAERLDEVAAIVTACPAVNHNYEREHRLNLWFVASAPDQERLDAVLAEIERRTGIAVIDLPLEREYRIDLGFPVQWS